MAATLAAERTGLASTPKVVLGCLAFGLFWLLAVFPSVRLLPIGRTAGALLAAVLMVVCQVLSPEAAFAAVDLSTLCLLFATMAISVFLERAHFFNYLRRFLEWRGRGGADLLVRVCGVSSITAALLTNDTVCVMLTPFVLQLARRRNLPPQPFLMALASSANLGSALTPIGNPQNLIISVMSGIGFGKFVVGVLPAVAVTSALNCVALLALYWRRLQPPTSLPPPPPPTGEATLELEPPGPGPKDHKSDLGTDNQAPNLGRMSQLRQPSGLVSEQEGEGKELQAVGSIELTLPVVAPLASQSHEASLPEDGDPVGGSVGMRSRGRGEAAGPSDAAIDGQDGSRGGGGRVWAEESAGRTSAALAWPSRKGLFRAAVYSVVVAMLGFLLGGYNLPWTALTASLTLICLDFRDAEQTLSQVSYSLLVFFCGLFISVEGFNATGVPGQLWQWLAPHCQLTSPGGTALLTTVIALLSNVASNVPTVLLLGPRVAAAAATSAGVSVTHAWLLLAFASTVAGNLTMVGSAANLIVSEAAYRAKEGLDYKLSFWNHLRFGFPSTCLMLAVGVPLIQG